MAERRKMESSGSNTAVKKLLRRERWLKRRDVALGILTPVILLALWQIASTSGDQDSILFPPPSSIPQAGWDLIKSGALLEHFEASLIRLALGYSIGAALGILVGLITGYFRAMRSALSPTFYALYAIPKIAILPLLFLIFGIGETPKIMVVVISAFFVVQINTMAGVRGLEGSLIEAGRSYGARGFKMFRYVILPGSLPSIFTGLRVATGLSIVVLVASEFVAGREGLGYLIWNSWKIFQPDRMFIGLVVVSLMGVAFSGVIALLERVALPWHASTTD